MYKKLLTLFFTSSLVLGACGSDTDPTGEIAQDTEKEVVVDGPGEGSDEPFVANNDLTLNTFGTALEDAGYDFEVVMKEP